MGEGGRVYLSGAGLSPFTHRSKCGWYSADFVWDRSALPQTTPSCQDGCRIRRKNTGHSLYRQRSWRTISGVTIDRLRSPVGAEAWPKVGGPSLVDLEKPDAAENRSMG